MTRPSSRLPILDELLELLKEHPATKAELCIRFDLPTRTIERALADLRQDGHRVVSVCEGRVWRHAVLPHSEEKKP